jgi:hypothetical protein
MSDNGRRRKVPRSTRDSDWTSTIPTVYGLDEPYFVTTSDKIESFYKYVEGQRLPRGLKGSRSLKDAAIEVLIRNLSGLGNLNDIPKHLAKCLWDMLKRRYVGFLFKHINSGQ